MISVCITLYVYDDLLHAVLEENDIETPTHVSTSKIMQY